MSERINKNPICDDSRACFAKKKHYGIDVCTILKSTYENGLCPFCKPDRSVTDGITYEFNPDYGKDYQKNKFEDLKYWE